MKTFSQYVVMREDGAALGDAPVETDDVGMMRLLKKAIQICPKDVMSFLQRLAKTNPDIQMELDGMNHANNNSPGNRGVRLGNDGSVSDRDDVVVPNPADMGGSELQ